MTLADVERCLNGMAEEGHETISINTIQTDSRLVEKGDLFFCIDGANFDGHEFAKKAVKSGAVGVVASRPLMDVEFPVIMVRNTTDALGRLAACWRDTCGATLVAVTGTAGKTTVKEMLHSVISQQKDTAKNFRNFNNQIGLPVSMLKANCSQEVWVMELGISRRGDMEELAPIASPDIAVITNVGAGHLEGLGDEAGVALAKTTLLRYLRQNGTAIINMDCPRLWDAAREIIPNPTGFSAKDETAPFFAEFLTAEAQGWGHFRLRTPAGETEFTAPFCGQHFAENVACVAAVCHALGLNLTTVVTGFKTLVPDSQRFCCKVSGNVTIIDDSYNANPLSMARSIETAAKMAGDKPLVLVLGDMRELGEEAKMHHEELGSLIKNVSPTAVFFKGNHIGDVICGTQGEGNVIEVNGAEEFITAWNGLGLEGAIVLVKGSRSLKMETFADSLSRLLGAKPIRNAGAPGEKA